MNSKKITEFKLLISTYHVLKCLFCKDVHNLQAETTHYWKNEYTPHLIYEPLLREVGYVTKFSASLSEGAYLDLAGWVEKSGQIYEATSEEISRFANYDFGTSTGFSIWHIEWEIEGAIEVKPTYTEGIPVAWKEYFSSIWYLEFEDAPISSDGNDDDENNEFALLDSFFEVLDLKLERANP